MRQHCRPLHEPQARDLPAAPVELDDPLDHGPRYKLTGRDSLGNERTLELPLTTADWAATEPRFEHYFRDLQPERSAAALPFHEFLAATPAGREGKVPFLWKD